MAWVRPTGRAGALQGEVFDKASRCKRRAREARPGARGAAKGRRGAALRRLSCNRSTEAVAQTLLSRLEPKKLLSLNLLSHCLFWAVLAGSGTVQDFGNQVYFCFRPLPWGKTLVETFSWQIG